MSIRPVDFNVMLPKTQNMSISKHNENIKNQNIVQSEFIQLDKNIMKQKSRVNAKEKINKTKIKKDKEFKENNSSQKENPKDFNEREDKEKVKKKNLGFNVDIRI